MNTPYTYNTPRRPISFRKKLSEKEIMAMREEAAAGASRPYLAAKYNVGITTVRETVSGQRHKDLPILAEPNKREHYKYDWTQLDKELLPYIQRVPYGVLSHLAEKYEVNPHSVAQRLFQMRKAKRSNYTPTFQWSTQEVIQLETLYWTQPIPDIAKILGRTPHAVMIKMYKLGLFKSERGEDDV